MYIQQTSSECLTEVKQFAQSLEREFSPKNHPFLVWFKNSTLKKEQLRAFGLQWYFTATEHKKAFPALVWNTPSDDVRQELIEILREEYGGGDKERIHAKLLKQFLSALDINDAEIVSTKPVKEVEHFGTEVERVWSKESPAYAFGLHYILERVAADIHTAFAEGVEKYDFLDDTSREYFTYHKIAEPHHADLSEQGLVAYIDIEEDRANLKQGIRVGVDLVQHLLDGFMTHIAEEKK